MSKPATPIDNKEAIAQLNAAMNLLVTDLVRPTMLQTQANARAIDRLTAQIDRAENIARLSDEASSENEQRFDILVAEAREDRRKSDERFEAMQQEIRALGEQNRALLSALASTNSRVNDLDQAG